MSGPLRFLLEHDRVVQAGAGTGKTHALLTQYLHLCAGATAHHRAIPPQQICALTFTEKAAAEMHERLVGRITKICRQLAESQAPSPSVALQDAEPALVESAETLEIRLPGSEVWEQLLGALGSATISTFHSFAASLLRRYAQTIGLDPEFSLLDEDSATQRLRETCEELVLSAIEDSASVGAGADLAETVTVLLGELGFASGAGGNGGLVEVLCSLHRQRAEEGRPSEGMAAAYLPDQLARELEDARLSLSSSLRELSSYASEIGGKRGEHASALGGLADEIEQRLQAIDDIPSCQPECARVLNHFRNIQGPRGAKADPSLSESIKRKKNQAKEAMEDLAAIAISQRAARLAQGLEQLLGPLSARFAHVKQQEAVLDFSDLLRKSRDLLRDHPSVRSELRQRYQVFLVDEFQDTSPLQAELLTLLVGDEGHSPGRLYIVGDRKQSIYDFRGADVAAFTRLCQRLIDLGADQETLDRSYRSLPRVLHFVNRLFAAEMQPPDDALPDWFVRWDAQNDPLTAHRIDGRDQARVELLRTAEEPVAETATATPVPAAIFRESELLARRVVALIDEGTRPGDIVVLLRRFTHLLHYTTALRRRRVPHYVVRGRGFFAAQEVLDLSSLLRLIDDPTDTLALVAVLRSPLVGLSDESLARLHLAGRLSLGALTRQDVPHPPSPEELHHLPADLQLRLPADEMTRLQRFLAAHGLLLAEADRLDPFGVLSLVLDYTDYLAVLTADRDGQQRLANVERLLERARAYRGRLRAFVRFVRLQTDPELARTNGDPSDEPAAQMLGENDNVIRIMTVHQAKGLEFPTVIVAGCTTRERNDLPQVIYDRDLGLGLALYEDGERCMSLVQRRIQARRKLRAKAESARLFYVAATRAKDRLIWLGESDRSSSNTWKHALERLLASPDSTDLLAEWRPSLDTGPLQRPVETDLAPSAQQRAQAEALARQHYDPPSLAPLGSTILTTQAAEFLACRRRYHLLHGMPFALSRPLGRARTSDETLDLPPLACLLAGTLPQRVLQLIDWQQQGEDLERCLAGLGILREGPQAQELLTWLGRLLRSRWLTTELRHANVQTTLRRAVRYRIPVGTAGQWRLHGVLDICWQNPDGTFSVVDVQLASPPPAEHAWHAARRALLGYVAQQLTGNTQPIRVGILYLQDADPSPKFETLSHAEIAKALAPLDELTGLPLPAHAFWHAAELPDSMCAQLGCELRGLCHGSDTSVAATAVDEY